MTDMTDAKVELVARTLYREAQLEAFKLGAPNDVPDFDNDDEDSRAFARRMARAAIAALEASADTPTEATCDHYRMVSGNADGPWTCARCGAVDPPRPKYGEPSRSPIAPVQDDDAEMLREIAQWVRRVALQVGTEADAAAAFLERIANRLTPTAEARELAELRAFKGRVLAAVAFEEPVNSDEIDRAVHDDIAAGMSLRKCAAKHGLTFGQVRGAAKRAALGKQSADDRGEQR